MKDKNFLITSELEAEKVTTVEKDKNFLLTSEPKQMKGELERAKVELTDYKAGKEDR